MLRCRLERGGTLFLILEKNYDNKRIRQHTFHNRYGKISEELKKRGFRITNEYSVREFPYNVLFADFLMLPHLMQYDEKKNEKYHGTIITNCKGYEDLTFITITRFIYKTTPEHGPAYIPAEGMTFTDAPYNDEFINEIDQPYKCDKCHKEFIKKDMISRDDKILCEDCYVEEIDKLTLL